MLEIPLEGGVPRTTVEKVKRGLTVVQSNYYNPEMKTELKFYIETQKYLLVPRHFPIQSDTGILSGMSGGVQKAWYSERSFIDVPFPGPPGRLTYHGQLFDTPSRPQVKAAKAAVSCLQNKKGGILVLPPGTGKTNLGIYLALQFGKTLILAHNDFLLCQWKSRLEKFVRGGVKVGLIQRDTCDYEGCDFVLGSLQSIHSRRYPKEALQYSMVIVDECHHIAAQTFFNAMTKIQYKYSLGLTATPKRSDNLTKMVEHILGKVFFVAKAPPNSRVQVNMISYTLGKNREIKYSNGVLGISSMVTNLTKDRIRNSVLQKIVKIMFTKFPNRKGLLLSDRVDHLKQIYRTLDPSMCTIITGNVHSDLTQKERNERKRKREEIKFEKFLTLSTYKLFEEAVDFDGDFIVLATPKIKVEQCTGRILRGRSSDHRPVIFDVVDNFSSFLRWSKTREDFYQERGYEILHLQEKEIVSSS